MRRVATKPAKGDPLHRLARKEPPDDSDLEHLRSTTIQSRSLNLHQTSSRLSKHLRSFLLPKARSVHNSKKDDKI
jgi:hypothetical protein